MEKITQVITNYINEKETDYAILINGQWGCGKTYHIRKNIFSLIEKIDSQRKKSKESAEKHKFIPLYISLYGLSSIDEILTRILQECFPILKGKIAMATNLGLNLFANLKGIDTQHKKEIKSFIGVKSNHVLFFDDLERINTDAVSIKSVLGHINTYTEHQNLKVIIISNDEKQAEEHYQEFKEKTIRFTNTFKANISDVFDTMCASKEEPYRSYILSQKDCILNIFTSANCQNLRTLKFLIDIFKEVHKEVSDEKYSEQILKRILLFTIIYTIEYKNGVSKELLEVLQDYSTHFSIDKYDDMFESSSCTESKKTDNEDKFENYRNKLDERYSFYKGNELDYISEITNLIQEGYLCSTDIAKTITKIAEDLKSTNETEEGMLLNKIINWREMEDDEFNRSVTQLITYVNEGRYTIPQLLNAYAQFVKFHIVSIEDFKITPDLKQRFKNAIDKAKANHKYDLSFRFTNSLWEVDDKSEAAKLFNEMLQYACEVNDSVLQAEKQTELDYFFNLIKSNNSSLLHNYRFGKDDNINFLDIPIDRLMPFIYNANAKTIHALHYIIYIQYPKDRVMNNKEATQINELFTNLDDYLKNQKPRTVSFAILFELRNHLENILKYNNQTIS